MIIKNRMFKLLLSVAISLLGILPLHAHHGDAGRYEDKIIEVSGTVVTLQFMNPHSRLIMDVADTQGKIIRWHAEFGNPNRMNTEFGWTRDMLKPGDQITLLGRRLKSGAPYINLTERAQVKLSNSGQEIYRTSDFSE